jgi:hypothetical protein
MSGKAMARTGLRMMPTFPLLPLKFRRADLLRYGFKAGLSDGAFPSIARSSRRAVCVRPSCPSLAYRIPRTEPRDIARLDTSVRAVHPLYPRGPRSGPGYSVPAHPHLIDPIRPTRRHTSISPRSGLYEMPSLCIGARAPTPRRPTSGSVLSLAILCRHVALWDPGRFIGCLHPVPSPMTLAFDLSGGSRHFRSPTPRFSWEGSYRDLPTVRFRYDLSTCSPPLSEPTRSAPSRPRLLRPGFRRIGHPHRRRI